MLGLTQGFNTDSGFEFNTLFNTFPIVGTNTAEGDELSRGRFATPGQFRARWVTARTEGYTYDTRECGPRSSSIFCVPFPNPNRVRDKIAHGNPRTPRAL